MKNTRKRTKLLSAEAVRRLIGVTTGERLAKRDRAILEVLYGSGIRVSELCGLDVEVFPLTLSGSARGVAAHSLLQ